MGDIQPGELPHELPGDVIEILRQGSENSEGTRIQGWAVKAATQEIARRYHVSQIEALRAVHYYMGGVPPDSRLHELPPDAVYVANRPTRHRQYLIVVRRAPAGSRMTDGYRLVETDTVTGARHNTFPPDWEGAVEQAQALYGIGADEWKLDAREPS